MRILIPGYEDKGWDEYEVPCVTGEIPAHAAKSLTRWMKRWIELEADQIIEILTMEWANIRDPRVARFRDVILKGRPCALATDGTRWSLALERLCPEFYFDRRTVYIEAPLQPEDLEMCLAQQGLRDHALMREFYTYFHGLRESGPVYAGNSERPEEWKSLWGIGWDENEFCEEYRTTSKEWLDALILYTTSTGDMVIRNAEDQTAWALMAENRVTPFAPSFAGFLEVCTKSYNLGFCLDYYQSDEIARGTANNILE
jgi:hypothetical protein